MFLHSIKVLNRQCLSLLFKTFEYRARMRFVLYIVPYKINQSVDLLLISVGALFPPWKCKRTIRNAWWRHRTSVRVSRKKGR